MKSARGKIIKYLLIPREDVEELILGEIVARRSEVAEAVCHEELTELCETSMTKTSELLFPPSMLSLRLSFGYHFRASKPERERVFLGLTDGFPREGSIFR